MLRWTLARMFALTRGHDFMTIRPNRQVFKVSYFIALPQI